MRPVLSASNVHAAHLCPGKPSMEKRFAREDDTPESLRGTELHQYFRSTISRSDLPEEDKDLLERAEALSDSFISEFAEQAGIGGHVPVNEDKELALDGIIPGHPDSVVTWVGGEYAVVLDLKTGLGDVEDAPSNYQLSVYASLVWLRKPFKQCGVAIVQPNAIGRRMTTGMYTGEQMPGLLQFLTSIRDATLKPDAPLVAGETQCQYCSAKAACPAFKADLSQLAIRETAIESVSDEELGWMLDVVSRVTQVSKLVKAEARTRIKDGRLTTHALRNSGDTRKCLDSVELFLALQRAIGTDKLTPRAFEACLDVSWGKLEELIQELTGLPEKKVKELVKNISEPHVKTEPKEKRIVAVKP